MCDFPCFCLMFQMVPDSAAAVRETVALDLVVPQRLTNALALPMFKPCEIVCPVCSRLLLLQMVSDSAAAVRETVAVELASMLPLLEDASTYNKVSRPGAYRVLPSVTGLFHDPQCGFHTLPITLNSGAHTHAVCVQWQST